MLEEIRFQFFIPLRRVNFSKKTRELKTNRIYTYNGIGIDIWIIVRNFAYVKFNDTF